MNVRPYGCAIVGGGPAGMMLGYLLARAGVDVVVLEKHGDFLRDFRGDTVHPSTTTVMQELDLLDTFLARPHDEVDSIVADFDGQRITMANFRHAAGPLKSLVIMPQWDFLDFLAEHARRWSSFHLEMNAEVIALTTEGDRIAGVRVRTMDGVHDVPARLVVGADGRRSVVRARAGLAVEELGAPIDVLWFRLPRRSIDGAPPFLRATRGRIGALIPRHDYYQCGVIVPKGAFEEIRPRGLAAFREDVATIFPFLRDRVGELRDWERVKLLTVTIDRLKRWARPGLLCIGDAAHAMSPIGGVGINLAIQDAVATANLLAEELAFGETPILEDLDRVQRRRELPTRLTQSLQIMVQNAVLGPALESHAKVVAPWPIRALDRLGLLQRITARVIGTGIRPEHVQSPRWHELSRVATIPPPSRPRPSTA